MAGCEEDSCERDLTTERLLLLLVLGFSVVIAPFYIVEWTVFTVVSLLGLQAWQWLFPGIAPFGSPKRMTCVEVKKRVKIIEHKNLYISQIPEGREEPGLSGFDSSSSFASTSLESNYATELSLNHTHQVEGIPSQIGSRAYEDIEAKVTGLRIRGSGCSGSAEAEYKLQITTPNGETWRVWRNYEDIYRVHAIVERVLESDKTRGSVFTRIVPSIPSRNFSSIALLFESRRSIMHRRRTGLDEFVSRVLGDKSADHYRKLALKIPQVREFLELSQTDTQFPKRALRKRKTTWLSRHRLFRKPPKSRPPANSYCVSSESEE